MALRRQLGANTIELDAQEGFARYWLLEPRTLSFDDMLEAAADASYTITRIELELEGTTSRAECEECQAEVTLLTIPATGQRLELSGAIEAGQTLSGTFDVSDWETEHPRLSLETPASQ